MTLDKAIYAPMGETNELFLFEEDDNIAEKYNFDRKSGGKWMIFEPLETMDKMWIKCCKMYRQGQFHGIKSIKCSTARINPKQSHVNTGVIMFHCGPADDQSLMMSYGQNIVEKLNYTNMSGNIVYKSDAQSALGTLRTGNTINSLYRVNVPKRWDYADRGRENSSPSTKSSSANYDDDDSSTSSKHGSSSSEHDSSSSSKHGSSCSSKDSDSDDSAEDVPTKTTDRYWIPKKNYDIAEKYPCDRSQSGYWLMVFNKAWLDKKWLKACELYEDGKLKGINSMRVSTARQFEGKYKFTGTILCYCGPSDDLEQVRSYGKNLAKRMDYFDNKGRMCYRTDKPKKMLLQIDVQSPWSAREKGTH